jgi:hypothetical protein
MKPWDKDYIAALQRHAIPVYTPTEAEINFWLANNNPPATTSIADPLPILHTPPNPALR